MVRREKNKGITLIALIIIIIVLLILASITISSLTGDNGIINRAIQAKELTEKAQIEEQIELQVMETIAEEGEFDSEKFKENVEENLGEYNPQITENEDTITVTIEETEVNIDKETGEIIGTVPKVEINVYDKEGNPVDIEEVIEDEVVITIEVTNKEELDEIEIIVKDENGEIIEKDTEITGEGDESYTIPGEGEYTITITNEGKVAGYARELVDYMPEGMAFSSDLNTNWYLGTDGNIYSTSLANTLIQPGETKTITLVLTRRMTGENTGTVVNTAEISQAYNEYGLEDGDSTPGNRQDGEDDIATATTLIAMGTGREVASFIGITLGVIAIVGLAVFLIKKYVIKRI